ncbi:hypothetical protein G4B88_003183 [Cannabis sativa]|uniref:Phosphofructokinase domain-containing protein n=1 Tax=Cannabis sativa TaxID=3483 RepID=A0A7J6DIX9_CANSA|nr:hypothetical protein G4B88_003183 [Cannabis sativa]
MDSDYGIPRQLSELQKLRSAYQPDLPPCLQGMTVSVEFGDTATSLDPTDAHTISRSFPHTYGHPLAHFIRASANVADAQVITEHPAKRVGIVFSGRQSPGGHNIIWGLLKALKIHNPTSTLLGFLGGSEGLFAQKTLEISDDILASYKNQGGYDLLGRTKDQIRTTEQVKAALTACRDLKLDGLVVIGVEKCSESDISRPHWYWSFRTNHKVFMITLSYNGGMGRICERTRLARFEIAITIDAAVWILEVMVELQKKEGLQKSTFNRKNNVKMVIIPKEKKVRGWWELAWCVNGVLRRNAKDDERDRGKGGINCQTMAFSKIKEVEAAGQATVIVEISDVDAIEDELTREVRDIETQITTIIGNAGLEVDA